MWQQREYGTAGRALPHCHAEPSLAELVLRSASDVGLRSTARNLPDAPAGAKIFEANIFARRLYALPRCASPL